ncbi:hypothetical protein [Mucilaginibacter gracilis]|uniref:hypothetical protein n=1 Tax=Mucilaginibacter gracilis TaxID=423350 RepID=UPI0011C428C2|nr:hypothetical protein [Mucilaginibacter gracilis]
MKGAQIDGDLLDQYLSASYTIMQEAITNDWQFSKCYPAGASMSGGQEGKSYLCRTMELNTFMVLNCLTSSQRGALYTTT